MSSSTILVLDTEVQPDYRFLAPEIAHHMPGSTEYRVFVKDPVLPDLTEYAGIVLGGSTASVTEHDRYADWLEPEFELIDRCLDQDVPLLGVCFGHQAVNAALGGTVVTDRRRSTFVEMAQIGEDEILEGITDVVPVLHADLVTELGEEMVPTARTEYNEFFCSRHSDKPVWTVQFHPEFTERVRDEPSDWDSGGFTFSDTNSPLVFRNFRRQVDQLA